MSITTKQIKTFLLIIPIAFVLAVVIGIVNKETQNNPAAKFETTVERTFVTNPSTAGVTFNIKNVGDKAKAPTCKVEASSSENLKSGTYYGQGTLKVNQVIEPNLTFVQAATVEVNDEGANYIKIAKVVCE